MSVTRLSLSRKEISFLVGAVRQLIDEAAEALDDARKLNDAEECEFHSERFDTFVRLEKKLTRAGQRLA